MTRVLVTGATGYIGGRLIPRLLEAGYTVRVLVRDSGRIAGRPWASDVETYTGDLLDPQTLQTVLADVDMAYYLVHSMARGGNFAAKDRQAAENFVAAGRHLSLVVYLGGILPKGDHVSEHLGSRAEVGQILREGLPTTEFRAGPIIGSGSASFEMVRYLTERLPAMIAPRWINNAVQPIAVRDVLTYLMAALKQPARGVVDIGAPSLTFKEMMTQYARARGLVRIIVPVPVLAPWLAARWVGLVTPIPNRLAVPLVEGLVHPVVGDNQRAREFFPAIRPLEYEVAVRFALDKLEKGTVETRWSSALADGPSYRLTSWAGLIAADRTMHVDADPQTVADVYCSLGGEKGWLSCNWAWWLRGLMDRLIGGPGLRRGRRHPSEIYSGEAIDFWRVEEYQPGRLLRLRAEMKLPGRAWLQFESVPEGDGCRLVQSALFAPVGLIGILYWYSMSPAHFFIFPGMIRRIANEAQQRSSQQNQATETAPRAPAQNSYAELGISRGPS